MTEKELNEIKKRADAATPGIWQVDYEVYHGMATANVKDCAIVRREIGQNTIIVRQPEILNRDVQEAQQIDFQNASFIAHAREDIPKLLAEIERLKNALIQPKREVNNQLSDIAADAGDVKISIVDGFDDLIDGD